MDRNLQKMQTCQQSNIRFSLCDIQNIQYTQKRRQKTATQPSSNLNYIGKNCDLYLIENLKRKMQQVTKQKKTDPLNKDPDFGTIITERKQQRLKHRVAYKRGLNAERSTYLNLVQKIKALQQMTSEISRMDAVEIFEYKQKMLNDYLLLFFKQMAEQCFEKSLFVSKLWETVHYIFEQLIKKLLKQLNRSQKMYLTECHTTHQRYQQKFEQYKSELAEKDKQVNKFKQIISKIALKNRKKCKKNREMSYGIQAIADRMTNLQRQRNQLKSQYVNMLTLGFEGGMEYNEAVAYAANKFRIQKQQQEQLLQQSICSTQKQMDLRRSKKTQSGHISNKIHKIKQKYIYGPNRTKLPIKQEDSDEEQLKNLGINLEQLQNMKKKKRKQKMANNSDNDSESSLNAYHENYVNKRIQTIPIIMSSLEQRKAFSTNWGINEKIKDELVKHVQVQTNFKRNNPRSAIFYDQHTQYSKDVIDEQSQQQVLAKVQENVSIVKPTESLNQVIEFEKQKTQSEIDKVQIFRPAVESPVSVLEPNKSLTIVKKQKQGKKSQTFNSKKRRQNPSVFKRTSIMAATNPSIFSNFATQRYSRTRNSSSNPITSNASKMVPVMKLENNPTEACEKPQLSTFSNNFYGKNNTTSSDEQSSLDQQSQIDYEQDYLQTNMLSFIENMSKLTPKGIYIDEAMLFLLKKSLFRIKHDHCDNVYRKNHKLITRIRSGLSTMKNVKGQALLTTKSVIKMLSNVYDNAYLQISIRQSGKLKQLRRRGQSEIGKKDRQQASRQIKGDHNSLNKEINLLELLKDCIKKEYPMYKSNQIEHKIVLIAKSVEYQTCSNYFIKNFMLLSCLDDNIFSSVIFSSDIQFYFKLLLQLNLKTTKQSLFKSKYKQNRLTQDQTPQARKNLNKFEQLTDLPQPGTKSFNGCYQNCFTNFSRLKQNLPTLLKRHYKKESLYIYIRNKINNAIQKSIDTHQSHLQNENQNKRLSNIRLDVFKCCHLIMQSIFSYKLDMLKSYAQIIQIQQISSNGLINQDIFIDLVGFVKMTKLEKLNTINKFRYDFSKNNTNKGISVIQLVNFCLNHDLPDLDQILFDTIQKFPVSSEICKQIQNLEKTYKNYYKIEKICLYLHKRNSSCIEETKLQKNIENKQMQQVKLSQKMIQSSTKLQNIVVAEVNKNICDQIQEDSSTAKNLTKRKGKQSMKIKDFWEIIGVNASKSLIHCKVVEIEASELLEKMLGKQITSIYMASLCQLQEKKHSKLANLRNSCIN